MPGTVYGHSQRRRDLHASPSVGAVVRDYQEGLRGYKARRNALLAEHDADDGAAASRSLLDALGIPQGPFRGEGA